MNRFLILWLLATSFITQGFGQGQTQPQPKPVVFTIVPKANVSGLNKTLDSLRSAISTIPGGGTANVSPSSVKPITDGLYPDLLKSANQYGVTPGSQVDQTFNLYQSFATNIEVTLQPGVYFFKRFKIPNGKTLRLDPGVELRGLALTASERTAYGQHYGLIELGPGSKLVGSGTVDGNRAGRPGINSHGVYSNPGDSLMVSGITVRNCAGSGIRYQNANKATIIGNLVIDCGNVGIENIASSNTRIQGNQVYFVEHGIQWWGNPAQPIFSVNVTITGNTVANIRQGGIWGYAGIKVTVTANTVNKCGDVLIDYEESYDCVASANTVSDGKNGGLTTFHGSERITFADNVVVQNKGFGPCVKLYGPNISKDITISGGSMINYDSTHAAIFTDAEVAENLHLVNIKTIRSAGNGVEVQRVNAFTVEGCNIYAAGPLGIQNTGGVGGKIERNEIVYAGSNSAGTKGIWLPWVSGTYSAQRNFIRFNRIVGFGIGIHNDASGDASGYNTITDNITPSVVTPTVAAGSKSIVERNRDDNGNFVDGTVVLTSAEKAKLNNTSGTNSGDQLLTLSGQKLILSGPNSSTVTLPISGTGTGTGATYAGSALIIVDFNSLGAGRGSSHEISNPDDYSPGPFPYTMMNTLAAQFPSATFAKKNFSVSGRQTPTMIANSTQVDALFAPATYDRQIIVSGEITNHIADGGATAQQAIDSYVSYCKARRAKGFLVVATTVFPRTSFFGSGMSAAEFASRRTVVNDYIKSRYLEFADVLADVNTISGLTYPDGTHLDDAGYVKMGNFIAGKVAPLLVTGFNPQSIAFLLSGTTTTPPSTTTTTTPPTTGTVTAGTVLLIAGTGSNNSTNITDATGKTVSRSGSPVISTAQSQYGGSSIYLDGSSFLTVGTSTDFDFGTGDFTIELFARPTELQRQFGGLISRGDETDNQWTFSYNGSSANPDLFIRNNGSYDLITTSSSGLTLNAWQHVALVSKGGVRKVYINGITVATSSNARSMETMATSKRINIGAFPTPNTAGSPEQEKFKGYLQGIKFTKGTALYDGNFTPPASL
jgi:hypothetical protein